MPVKEGNWKDWNTKDWNKALLEHFFLDSDGQDRPVQRIPVTSEELLKIASDPSADAQEVQESFLRAVRTRSHIDFNHRLSGYIVDPNIGWNGSTVPPFFIDLAFSCLVASPSDGEIRNTGDFRRRLAMLLGHDVSVAYYPLGNLASLWRAFSKWIDSRRAVGEPYRRLILPDEDYRVLIGYSINLAFPPRKDMVLLTKLFSGEGFTEEPPIPAVFTLVGREAKKFSTSFRKAYEEFRQAFTGKVINLEQFLFWGAVRDAIASVHQEEREQKGRIRELKLVLEGGGTILLLSNTPGAVISRELTFIKADTPYGEFAGVLCAGHEISSGSRRANQNLLNGRYRLILAGKGWQAISIAIEQGLLLFEKTEQQSWELVFTRPEEGEIQGLIRNSLLTAFLDQFPYSQRPEKKVSEYEGWTGLDYFPAEWLKSLTYMDYGPLAEIRCLQPTFSEQRISFIGGCAVDGGYLGLPACLPLIRSPSSSSVRIFPIDGRDGRELIELRRVGRHSNDFSFPNLTAPLNGCYLVIGSLEDKILRKEIVFYPEIVANDYARPTNPNDWEVETGGPDVVTYDREGHPIPRPSGNENKSSHTKKETTGSLLQHIRSLKLWPRVETLESAELLTESADFTRANNFMELCGGLAMRRKGISEPEFLELLRDYMEIDRYDPYVWDVARAWIEGGYFDTLQYKKWRRTEYFARIPRFILDSSEGAVRGILFGLATMSFRNRADIELLKRGSQRKRSASRSISVVPAPQWTAPSADIYGEVSKLLGLEQPIWKKPVIETLWSLNDVVDHRVPPRFYELWGCWDWDHGWLSKKIQPTRKGVEVIRFQRPDRPSYYQVTVDGEHFWWSISRNWALLLAYELRGEPAFAFAGARQIVRISKGRLYLPLPVGRHLAMSGMTIPGPFGDADQSYAYDFRDSKERMSILSSIWRKPKIDASEMSRWARWILAISKVHVSELDSKIVRLPNSIRKQLEQIEDVPEFLELSRTRLMPSLIPRVRGGLARFRKLREL